jgi:hypothetical protein
MDPDAPWQGSQEAAPGKAVEAEHDPASRSYVQRDGKTVTIDAKGHVKRLLASGAMNPEPLDGRVHPTIGCGKS